MKDKNIEYDFLTNEEIYKKAKPQNYMEKTIVETAVKHLGENTTAIKLAKYLNVSKSHIYKAMEERKIVSYRVGYRLVIMTRSILNIVKINE